MTPPPEGTITRASSRRVEAPAAPSITAALCANSATGVRTPVGTETVSATNPVRPDAR